MTLRLWQPLLVVKNICCIGDAVISYHGPPVQLAHPFAVMFSRTSVSCASAARHHCPESLVLEVATSIPRPRCPDGNPSRDLHHQVHSCDSGSSQMASPRAVSQVASCGHRLCTEPVAPLLTPGRILPAILCASELKHPDFNSVFAVCNPRG